jgi:hypothetical protein
MQCKKHTKVNGGGARFYQYSKDKIKMSKTQEAPVAPIVKDDSKNSLKNESGEEEKEVKIKEESEADLPQIDEDDLVDLPSNKVSGAFDMMTNNLFGAIEKGNLVWQKVEKVYTYHEQDDNDREWT